MLENTPLWKEPQIPNPVPGMTNGSKYWNPSEINTAFQKKKFFLTYNIKSILFIF